MKGIVGIIAIVVLGAIIVLSGACATSSSEARGTLEKAGYAEIKTTGVSWTACDDDKFGREFEATAPNGVRSKGVVCCNFTILGIGKGCTVRF